MRLHLRFLAISFLSIGLVTAAQSSLKGEDTRLEQDLDKLMLPLLSMVHEWLTEHGQFHPFGAGLTEEEEVSYVGVGPTDSIPSEEQLMEVVHGNMNERIAAGEFHAVALVSHVIVNHPDTDQRVPAVKFELEHSEGLVVEIFHPYVTDEGGVVQFAEAFGHQGEKQFYR